MHDGPIENMRQLAIDDLAEVQKLWTGATSLLKEPYQRTGDSAKGMLQNPIIRVYGWFAGGELQGTICLRLWEALPYFTLVNMVGRTSNSSAVKTARRMNHLLGDILSDCHAQGRFTFFIATIIRPRQLRLFYETGKIVHSKYFEVMDNYEISVEAIVPPNTISAYPTYSHLLGNQAHEHPLWIRRYTLPGKERLRYFAAAAK